MSSAAPEKESSLGNSISNLPVMDVKDILSQGPRAFMSHGSFRCDHEVELSFICSLNTLLELRHIVNLFRGALVTFGNNLNCCVSVTAF